MGFFAAGFLAFLAAGFFALVGFLYRWFLSLLLDNFLWLLDDLLLGFWLFLGKLERSLDWDKLLGSYQLPDGKLGTFLSFGSISDLVVGQDVLEDGWAG